ncbi:MAG TPA: hypothetical protein VIE67_09355 [Rudaea sp.]|uniref:hypothetical protein n=1 Tax=Rudaea sp. TaxID=2136325 RepID=UPI002F92EFD5
MPADRFATATATAGAAARFVAVFVATGFAGRELVACLTDFFAEAIFFVGRCGLTTAADRLRTAAALRAIFFGAGFLTARAVLRGCTFLNATGFFVAGFFAGLAAAFFFAAGTDLRFEVAISLTIVARRSRVIA